MGNLPKLDVKDYEILRELDINFRQSFSKIGKKVRLSKNSVALRFKKIKEYTLHNTAGLDNELLGYKFVKVYYSFNFYNEDIEKAVIKEVKKHKNIMWAARYYGLYDVGIGLYVDDLNNFISQLNKFDKRFAGRISQKEIQVLCKQIYFRHNFLHKEPIFRTSKIDISEKRVNLSLIEKKILKKMINNPRINVVDIAESLGTSPKTVSNRIKSLEKSGVIMGYFMTLDPAKFNYSTLKLLIQLQNMNKSKEFEDYLHSIKNVKYIAKMVGLWDYEVDFIYPSIIDLQKQIELIKEKFPNLFKKIEIVSFGKRIITNTEKFLV